MLQAMEKAKQTSPIDSTQSVLNIEMEQRIVEVFGWLLTTNSHQNHETKPD